MNLLSKAKKAPHEKRGRITPPVSAEEIELVFAYCCGEITAGQGAATIKAGKTTKQNFYQWAGSLLIRAVREGRLVRAKGKS